MFFSARGVVRKIFRQVKPTIQQHLKTRGPVAEMHAHHAIVNLPAIAIVLPTDARGLLAALGRARLVDAANRPWMGVLGGHDLLAAISQLFFIPLDRFEEPL